MTRQQKLKNIILQALLCLLLVAPQVAAQDNLSTQVSSNTIRALEQASADFRREGKSSAVSLILPTVDSMIQFSLEAHDIRSRDFLAEITTHEGKVKDPSIVSLFRDPIEDSSTDFARFVLISKTATSPAKLLGYFRYDGVYYHAQSSESSTGVLKISSLSEAQAQAMIAHCGVSHTDALHMNSGHHDQLTHEINSTAKVRALKVVELATEADYEFSLAESSPNAAILAITSAVDAIYRQQLNLTLKITYQHTWIISNDPYTTSNPEALLEQYTNYWVNNSSVPHDVGHMWTAREIDGNVVGIAWLGTVCSHAKYGLSQRLGNKAYDVPVTAHEIGHNFNANHDNCNSGQKYVMCPSVVSNASVFSSVSASDIATFVSGLFCLSVDDGGTTPKPPVLSAIGDKSVNEGETLSIKLSAKDPNGETLSYRATPLPANATFNGAIFRYTPSNGTVPANQSSISYSVSFIAENTSGLSDEETITITVGRRGNQAPVLSAPAEQTVKEGNLLSVTLQAYDPNGDNLSFYSTSPLPAGAILSSTGTFSWRPSGEQSGAYALSLSVRDSAGASDSTTLKIKVLESANVPPMPAVHRLGDFNGDGRADLAIFRPVDGNWYMQKAGDSALFSEQWGLSGDIPVPQDYDGDRISDIAVFRESTSSWYIRYSGTGLTRGYSFGVSGDLPATADYDGDGRADLAVFRPSVGAFIVAYSSSSSVGTITIGQSGDIPVPCDYDGDDKTNFAVFRPQDGSWHILSNKGELQAYHLGIRGDHPVPADYTGNGRCEKAVWRPSEGNWYIEGSKTPTQFGLGEDIPVPLHFHGNASAEIAVWRPSTAIWYIRKGPNLGQAQQLGLPTDQVVTRESNYFAERNTNYGGILARGGAETSVLLFDREQQTISTLGISGITSTHFPLPPSSYIVRGNYDGDQIVDNAHYWDGWWTIWRSSAGTVSIPWGLAGDIPVSGDFDGDGLTDIAVFRADGGDGFSYWYIIRSSDNTGAVYQWGLAGDQAIPADFNGDGWTDLGVWRESLGWWFVLDARSRMLLQSNQWGLPGDIIRAADFDADGRADKIVWRKANGVWYILLSGGSTLGTQWGLPGDTPVPGAYLDQKNTDFAVYRPTAGMFYILSRTGDFRALPSGLSAASRVVGIQPYVAAE